MQILKGVFPWNLSYARLRKVWWIYSDTALSAILKQRIWLAMEDFGVFTIKNPPEA